MSIDEPQTDGNETAEKTAGRSFAGDKVNQ